MMGVLVGHTNHTGDESPHETTYGSGMAVFIVFLGLLAITAVFVTPYYYSESYYTPLGGRSQKVVLVTKPSAAANDMKPVAVPIATPSNVLVATVEMGSMPSLSGLKSV